MAAFDRFIETPWAYLVLAMLVLVAAFPGAVNLPVLDRDEARFTQASSQMMETGDYVVIRYQDDLRNKKPVGIHWLQSAAVSLTSNAADRNITAYRLPSLIAGMLGAIGLLWGGQVLVTRRAAFLGAALCGLCLLFTTEAHIAKTDAAMTCAVIFAMGAMAWLRSGAGRWTAILFWVALAAGTLIKGPVAPMVVGLTIAALFIWERRIEWARPLIWWVGPSLFLILTAPWFLAIQIATEGEFLWEAAGVDLGQKIVGAAEGHAAPPGFHLLMLPILFWPATLFLVPGLWRTFRGALFPGAQSTSARPSKAAAAAQSAQIESDTAGLRFLLCWAIPCWLVFELTPTKLIHYTLPAYPALALMAGAALDDWFSTGRWRGGRTISIALFAVAGFALAALTSPWALAAIRADAAADFAQPLAERVAWIWSSGWEATGVSIWPMTLIMIATGGAIYATIVRSPVGALTATLACAMALAFSYRVLVLPNQTWVLPTKTALEAIDEICARPAGAPHVTPACASTIQPRLIRAIAYNEPSLVFSLGGKAVLEPDATTVLPEAATDPRPAWILNTADEKGRAALAELVATAAAADRCIRVSRRYALNYSNGDPAALVAAVIEPGGCAAEATPENLDLTRVPDAAALDETAPQPPAP